MHRYSNTIARTLFFPLYKEYMPAHDHRSLSGKVNLDIKLTIEPEVHIFRFMNSLNI